MSTTLAAAVDASLARMAGSLMIAAASTIDRDDVDQYVDLLSSCRLSA